MLLAYSSPTAKVEFLRRLKLHFAMTGGVDEATKFCGLTIERDWSKKTIKVHQEAFARRMMDNHGVWGTKPDATLRRIEEKNWNRRRRNQHLRTRTRT